MHYYPSMLGWLVVGLLRKLIGPMLQPMTLITHCAIAYTSSKHHQMLHTQIARHTQPAATAAATDAAAPETHQHLSASCGCMPQFESLSVPDSAATASRSTLGGGDTDRGAAAHRTAETHSKELRGCQCTDSHLVATAPLCLR